MEIMTTLENLKRLFKVFEWKLADQRSDVDLVVNEIDRIRVEELYPYSVGAKDRDLQKISDLVERYAEKCRNQIKDIESPIEASLAFTRIDDPSNNIIVAKINTWIYSQNKNLHVFIQEF